MGKRADDHGGQVAAGPRLLTPEIIAQLLTGLDAAPGGEGGPRAMYAGLSDKAIGIKAVEGWIDELLARRLIRVARIKGGRTTYARFELNDLSQAGDARPEWTAAIRAVLAGGPAMPSVVATRLGLGAAEVQSAMLHLWQSGELSGTPVGAGFVFRLVGDAPQEAAELLKRWDASEQGDPSAPPAAADEMPPAFLRRHKKIQPGTSVAKALERLRTPGTCAEVMAVTGQSSSTTTSMLTRLVRTGELRRVEEGVYQTTDLGRRSLNPERGPQYLTRIVKPVPPGRGWTPERVAWLEEYFPRLGGIRCAELLKVKPETVYHRSGELGLTFGDVPGYIPVRELERLLGLSRQALEHRADGAGVRCFTGTNDQHRGRAVVPVAWADAISAEYGPPDSDDVLVKELFPLFRLSRTSVLKRVAGQAFYRTTASGERGYYLKRSVFEQLREEARGRGRLPVRLSIGAENILAAVEAAGPQGCTANEIAALLGAERSWPAKMLNRAVRAGQLAKYPAGHRNVQIYRSLKYQNQPPPVRQAPDVIDPRAVIEELVRQAGAFGVTEMELAKWIDPDQCAPLMLEGHLRDLRRQGKVERFYGGWNSPAVYRSSGVAGSAPPPRLIEPPESPDSAVLEHMQRRPDGADVEELVLAMERPADLIRQTLSRLASKGLLSAKQVRGRRGVPRMFYRLVAPPSLRLPAHAPSRAPPPVARAAACRKPSTTQEIRIMSVSEPLAVPQLSAGLTRLESLAQPLEALESRLADIDRERAELLGRIEMAKEARQVLDTVTRQIQAALGDSGAKFADMFQPALPLPGTATEAVPPGPQPSPVEAAPEEGEGGERRRAPPFPVPVPEGLSVDGLQLFKVLRTEVAGLPFKQLCARQNMNATRASKALKELTDAGHVKLVGNQYRAQARE